MKKIVEALLDGLGHPLFVLAIGLTTFYVLIGRPIIKALESRAKSAENTAIHLNALSGLVHRDLNRHEAGLAAHQRWLEKISYFTDYLTNALWPQEQQGGPRSEDAGSQGPTAADIEFARQQGWDLNDPDLMNKLAWARDRIQLARQEVATSRYADDPRRVGNDGYLQGATTTGQLPLVRDVGYTHQQHDNTGGQVPRIGEQRTDNQGFQEPGYPQN